MKKYAFIILYSHIDYDSRVIRECQILSKEYKVVLYCLVKDKASLNVFEGYDVEAREIIASLKSKLSIKFISDCQKAYESKFNLSKAKLVLYKKLGHRYSFLDLHKIEHPGLSWIVEDIRKIVSNRNIEMKNSIVYTNDINPAYVGYALKVFYPELIFVVDLHEAFFTKENRSEFTFKKNKYLLEKLLPHADHFLTAGEKVLQVYKEKYNVKNGIVIYNAPFISDVKNECTSTNKKRLVHVGGAAPNRNLHKMIEAMSHLDDSYELYFHLIANSQDRIDEVERLKKVAHDLGVANRVYLKDPFSPSELIQGISQYDIGLFYLEAKKDDHNHNYASPNKIFEYMHARLPMVVTDIGDMSRIVDGYEIGISSKEDVLDFANAIKKLSSNYDLYESNIASAIKEFNAQKQFDKLLVALRRDYE